MVAALVIVLAINVPAISQLIRTGGPLYYVNADAEPLYLQFDTSVNTQSLFSRAGQYLVTLLHLVGVPGGWINFIFDCVCPLLFLYLVRAAALALDFGEVQSGVISLLAALGPVLTNYGNPLLAALYKRNIAHSTICYISTPWINAIPIVRTPEPQFSLVILAIATLFAIKRKSFVSLYCSIPLLYPFVAIPMTFIILTLHIRRFILSSWAKAGVVAPIVSYVLLSLGSGLAFALTAKSEARAIMAPGHAPILSFTSIVSIMLYLTLRSLIRPNLRYPALILALAPMAAENLQIITGWLAQPSNVEQYAGTECIALILGISIMELGAPKFLSGVVLGLTLLLFSSSCVRTYHRIARTPVLDSKLLAALKTDARHVVVSDGYLARVLFMVFPKEPRTALDSCQPWRFYVPFNSQFLEDPFEQYLDVRNIILRDSRRSTEFKELIEFIDKGYAHRNEDFKLYHIGRKTEFAVNIDVASEASRRKPSDQRLIYVTDEKNGILSIDP
ncbi:MAG: hypothetical protein HQM08_24545 [Candidatus Riflebacteria bacterium]|nr:hypothetical protein [Candidatus Riflebacteria bacterium]